MPAILALLALALFLQPASSPPAQAKADPAAPAHKRTIPLKDVSGRIDHFAYDPDTHRVFIAALGNSSLEVVDLDKGERVGSIPNLKEPQGIACLPQTKQFFVACGGDGTVHAYDAATLKESAHIHLGDDADNVRRGLDGKSIIVGHSSGAVAILDAATLKTSAEIKLPDHPESFQIDPDAGRAYVNVPGGFIGGGGQVTVIDLKTNQIAATWKLKEGGRNFPMALDAAHKRLFVGCRRPAKLLVIDTDSGKVLSSPECIGDTDDLYCDAKTGRIYVIGGDGALDVFESKDNQTYTRITSIKTAPGARTGLLIPERRSLLIAVPKRSDHDAELREYSIPE
jgi:DNA-binding beta-propeller fold protein YncE